MSNSGKVWDTREAYQEQRANTWETPGNRGMRLGGQTTPGASESNTVEFVDMTSTGNTADFGDLSQARKKGAGGGGFTRILCLGGQTPSVTNTIDFVNPVATGNFSDFGDLVNAGATTNISHCNNVKTISADGSDDADGIVITQMASQGNSSTFQNRTSINNSWACGTGDNTRFLMAGGYPATNQIDAMQIATEGSQIDFGNLTSSRWGIGAVSNTTRSVFMGGNVSPGTTNVIDFVTTQSAGNATDFGDLTTSVYQDSAGASNSKTGIIFGYQNNTINSINIATTGNATDFGDTLTSTFYQIIGADNGGGGLPQEGAFPQRASVTYMPGSGRAIICGGPPSPKIETFNISTLGNTVTFGSLILNAENWGGGCGNATRMLAADGGADSGYTTQIEAIQLSSFGNASDFGDSTSARANQGSLSNSTRGVWGGGYDPDGSPAYSNVIDYVTIATFGNASDFGDLTTNGSAAGGTANSTRGLFGPRGPGSGVANVIDYITIGSTGNTTDFGDASVARSQCGMGASSTRALLGGGGTPSKSNVIDYVTIGSTGNATDFGDLTVSASARFCVTNNTRAVWGGGYTGSPTQTNVLDYVTIATTGNAADFGDIASGARGNIMSSSDSHGGLQSS